MIELAIVRSPGRSFVQIVDDATEYLPQLEILTSTLKLLLRLLIQSRLLSFDVSFSSSSGSKVVSLVVLDILICITYNILGLHTFCSQKSVFELEICTSRGMDG